MSTNRFPSLILVLNGVIYIGIGLALILVPEWFFTNIGNFPPFNRHYEGDFGTFLLPLGAGFLYAAKDPARHIALLGVAAAGGFLHALNHVYDSVRGAGGWDQTLALLLFAGLTLAALWQVVRDGKRSSTTLESTMPTAGWTPSRR